MVITPIQYLRGIAALLVVGHHAPLMFPGAVGVPFGAAGVDIFFVISGFIMAHSTRGFDPRAPFTAAADFLRRRFLRVVPLYWLALALTAWKPIVAGAVTVTLLKDFAFWPRFHETGMGRIWPALVPGWTINYEMFFYAAFGLAMLFGARRYFYLAAFFLMAVLLGLLVPWQSAPAEFYSAPLLLEFLAGILTYRLTLLRPPSRTVLWLALVGAVAVLVLDNGPVSRALADGPFAAVIVWASVHLGRGVRWRALHALGDASYSMYLFHLGAFTAVAKVWKGTELPGPLALALALLIGAAVGLLMHRLIEQPLLALLSRRKRAELPVGAAVRR